MAKPGSITDLPQAFQDYLHGVYTRADARIAETMAAHGVAPGIAAAVASTRVAVLDEELAPVVQMLAQGGSEIACRKGCAFCCTHTVDVTPDEVFAIVAHLSTLGPATVAAIRARAANADAVLHGLGKVERHAKRIPCPVLDPATSACLAHPVRPNACQGYLSVDRDKCEADHDDPPQPVEQPTVAPMITSVVDSTRSYRFADAGAPQVSLELIAGLLAAWADPEAERRWLAGEAIFPGARSVT